SGQANWSNMVWEVKTKLMPDSVQKVQVLVEESASRMDDTFEMLKCTEDLPSSPGCPSSENRMEYDDLPELQAVQEDRASPAVFQLSAGVSHQERPRNIWSPRPSCPPAGGVSPEHGTSWLAELANIATSPQSPLMQCTSSPVHIIATSNSLHSYARPPPASSSSEPSLSKTHWKERAAVKHERASSESESGIFCMSSLSDDDDLGWSHSWPSTAWHCFLKGTRLRFHKGNNVEWQDAEDLADSDDESEDERDSQCHSLKARWSSFYPSLTVVQHGIPCYEMQVGDLCLPPGHPDAINFDDSVVFDTFRSYDFTPLDSSAVYVLSSMARQRRASLSSGGAVSPDCEKSSRDFEPSGSSQPSCTFYSKSNKSHSSGTANSATPTKCKRPMNAFMLFAKKYRVEYTQMYPGKDNRAISVILGDRWKKMKNEERRMYTMEAKALAEEQKRLNPDCWKRKRTSSVRTCTSSCRPLGSAGNP
ncbi:HBP1 protein, partial [Atractosteus spatula]|nr:HBP1 protein [Atractosteus spatula]